MALTVATLGLATPAHADEWRYRQWHLEFLNANEVHEISQGEGVTVAVVDTGVDRNHPDLSGNVAKGADTAGDGDGQVDLDGHGTAMASLIAGHGHGPGNRDGILGLAPKATILPVRNDLGDLDPEGADDRPRVIGALQWAINHGSEVINFSARMSGIRPEIARAFERDIVFVAAAGNGGQDLDVQQPASYPGVIAVSGVDRDGNFTDVSVQGPEVVLSAPAVDLATAGAGKRGAYNLSTGTSGAAALVSATAALIRAKYPDLSANGVINRLIKTADDKGPPGRDPQYGFGVVNPLKALTADIPDIDYNPLIEPSSKAPATPTSRAGSPGAGAATSAGNLLPALGIVASIFALVAGVIYGAARRSRRRRVGVPAERALSPYQTGGAAGRPQPGRPGPGPPQPGRPGPGPPGRPPSTPS